jgi:hypothetical protein
MKGSVVVEGQNAARLTKYAHVCGWTLARAHAKAGDPIAIASYLGNSDTFDRAVSEFSAKYADQNDLDFTAFTRAIKEGRIEADDGV